MDKISKFRFKYLFYTLGAFLFLLFLDFEFLAFIAALVVLYVIYSFRDPEVELQNIQEGGVVAPVDGKVVAIEEIDDDSYRYKLTVTSTLFDKAIVRMPMKGSVTSLHSVHGTRVSNTSPLFEKLNEHATLVIEDTHGNDIKILHRLRQSFAPLFFDIKNNATLPQTARYGIALYSDTTIYLGEHFRMDLHVGDTLTAGETLLGYYSN